MRLDSANRSFATLVLSSLLLGMYAISGAAGCVLVPLIIARASHRGVGGLFYGSHNLLAALAFLLLISVGLALGIISARRQIRASRALAFKVHSLSLKAPEGFEAAVAAAGLAGRVVLVDCPEWFSFAFGALTPKVAVSRGLFEGLSAAELRAVLEHECYHVRNLDPLKMLIVGTLPKMFFFLPALAALRSRYVLACELAADRHAVRTCGREPLVRARIGSPFPTW
jgi:Zn-dependent protease with chaperone function